MLFKKKTVPKTQVSNACVSSRNGGLEYKIAGNSEIFEEGLYSGLRKTLPVLDAGINKIVRLVCDFKLVCSNDSVQEIFEQACKNIPVGISGESVNCFADMFLNELLTSGKAVGQMVFEDGSLCGIAVENSADVSVFPDEFHPCKRIFYKRDIDGDLRQIRDTEKLLYTTLSPTPENPQGVSILRGLPAISDILLRIYECIGQNFDRVGNVRYAVTYNPEDGITPQEAMDRAKAISKEWSEGMAGMRNGIIKDFVCVGDVGIKVIGAENQIIDTEVPVRQLLEQLVAKLGIPPFMLGLNWSSTERMSQQQADILTSELEYYRRLLTPVLERLGNVILRSLGQGENCHIVWANINLQDEVEIAQARLDNAKAMQIENQLGMETKRE